MRRAARRLDAIAGTRSAINCGPDKGVEPRYQQKRFEDEEKRERLCLIVSPEGSDGSITIQQDARVYAALLDPSRQVVHELKPKRHAWVQVPRGAIAINGQLLKQGDGAAIIEEMRLTLIGKEPSEVLLFDLA